MDTPDTSHIDADFVYEPREDSFLLLDAIEHDLEFIRKRKCSLVCEMGCGSGVVLCAVAKALGPESFYLAVDVSPFACQATYSTLLKNKCPKTFDIVNMDLFEALHLHNDSTACQFGKIDLLIFNPPYVCCEDDLCETESDSPFLDYIVDKAWNGGPNGTDVLLRVIQHLSKIIAPQGLFYLVAIPENDLDKLNCEIMKQGFSKAVVVKQRKIIGEHLHVLKFTKIH